MTQMWLLWWPKNTFSTKRHGEAAATSTTAMASAAALSVSSCNSFSTTSSHCPCITKVVRKLKKHARMMGLAPSRQSSFQCNYDPLSYSLNFDDTSTGCQNLLDEDYYQYCAFSSRFVANPRTCPRPVALAH